MPGSSLIDMENRMKSRASIPALYRLFIVTVSVIAAIAGIAALRASGPWFVAMTGSDSNDCLTLATACQHIYAAFAKAEAGDIIIVADGTYTENLTLNKNITLIGFGQDVTTINGGGVSRIITVTAGTTAVVSNATLTNGLGEAPLWTAGIYVSGTLRLSNSTIITSNDIALRNDGMLYGYHVQIVRNSEGIWNTGTALLDNLTVYTNNIGIRNLGTLRLTNSAVLTNADWAYPGAGIANLGVMEIDRTLLRNNIVLDAPGGGIYNAGIITISNSLIISNTAYHTPSPGSIQPQIYVMYGQGGGIYNDYYSHGMLTLRNSALYGNSANNGGDQLWNGGVALIVNSTLSGDAGHNGLATSGLITFTAVTISEMPSGIAVSPGTFFYNSIADTHCLGTPTSLGHNIDSGNTCGFTATGDLTNTNPLLGPLQDNGGPTATYAIPVNSPAVNAGDNAVCPPTDQRGVARPQAGRCDIGAYEYVFPANVYLPFVAR